MNRFITETEVEDAKKKRAEEWEAARAAGRDVPDIDEPVDTRCLYERLKEQKDTKQEAFEEQLKFKNMIYKGLNEEDADFLGMVAKKQAELDDKRYDEQSEEIRQYRAAVEESSITTKTSSEVNAIEKNVFSDDFKKKSKKKQQAALLTASIKKKRKSEPEEKVAEVPSKKSKEVDQTTEDQEKTGIKPENIKGGRDSSDIANSGNKCKINSLATLADYPSSSEED